MDRSHPVRAVALALGEHGDALFLQPGLRELSLEHPVRAVDADEVVGHTTMVPQPAMKDGLPGERVAQGVQGLGPESVEDPPTAALPVEQAGLVQDPEMMAD